MDGQENNGVVPPVGGEISSSTPNPSELQTPVLETPKAEEAPAVATPEAPVNANPTASFAQSTVGVSGTTATPQFTTTPQPVMTTNAVPGKKGGAGKIIALIVILLLLIGGGIAAFLIYRAHESDERVMADALKSILERDAMSATTTVTITGEEGEYKGAKLTLNLDSVSDSEGQGSFVIDAKLEGTGEIPNLNAKLEAVEGKEALYVKVADYGNIAQKIGELSGGEETEYMLSAMFNEIGNSWYEIPYSKLGKQYSDMMDCVREVSKDLKSGAYTKEIGETFAEYRFLSFDGKPEKVDGYKLYKVKADEELASKFLEELENTEFYKNFSKCSDSSSTMTSGNGAGNIFKGLLGNGSNSASKTADDLLDDPNNLIYDGSDDYYDDWTDEPEGIAVEFEPDVYFGITGWSHKLVAIKMTGEDDGIALNIETKIDDGGSVNIPSDTKSLDDLEAAITKVYNENRMNSRYSLYCTKEKNYSGYGTEEDCKKAVDSLFGGGSSDTGGLDSLIDGFSI